MRRHSDVVDVIRGAARCTSVPGSPRVALLGLRQFVDAYRALPQGRQKSQQNKWTLLYEDTKDADIAEVASEVKLVARSFHEFMLTCVKMRE